MPKKGGVPTLLLFIVILASLSIAGGAFYLYQQESRRSLDFKERLNDVKAKTDILESRLDDKEKEIAQYETQIRETKSQIDFLTSELQTEKKTKQNLTVQIEQLKVDLDKERSAKKDLEDKLTQSQQMLKTLQTEFKDLESKKAELEVKVGEEEADKDIELGTIYVAQQPSAVEATTNVSFSLEGKILVLNKDYDFVVINLGSKDGVNLGDIFSIYHNEKYLGEVKVEKVHQSMSAANFLEPQVKDKVREGDKVTIKQNK